MLQSHGVLGSLEPWGGPCPRGLDHHASGSKKAGPCPCGFGRRAFSQRGVLDLTEFVFLGFGFSREVSCLLDVLFLYLGMECLSYAHPSILFLEASHCLISLSL